MLDLAVKYAYLWWRTLELNRFLASAKRSQEIQRKSLFAKLNRHAPSTFGIDHGFADIRTVGEYRRRIPITNFEYYQSYIDQVKQGRVSAMYGPGTKVLMFAITSGTTNQTKYVPVTQESFDEYRHGWNLWGIGAYRDHPDLVSKKTLKLGSNCRQFLTESGTPCGAISGLVAETAPWIARSRFVLPSAVYQIDDSFVKHYVALRLAIANPHVGMIGTANPSTLIEFARMLNDQRENLIRDIHDGTLFFADRLPAGVRLALQSHFFQRSRPRAQSLERIVDQVGTLYPRDVWPELSVIAVWMGGSVSVYIPKLEPYYGQPAIRDHGLNASEARMTMPLRDGTSEGVIEFNHHFYEFVPVSEIDANEPVVLEAHELEEGQDYYILLTTSAGLYRYDIRDVVRCTGFMGQAPLLVFLNKGAHFSSITGEKLSEYQVISAVKRAQEQVQLDVGEFCVAPQMQDRPVYVLMTESAFEIEDQDKLAQCIDHWLGQLNYEYAEKRRSGRLLPLTLRQVSPGTWLALRKNKSAARGNFEEYKHRWLVGDLGYIDQITKNTSLVDNDKSNLGRKEAADRS
ncbi:MAG: GH3 auxin-responsive promoter family protein [Pirellulaceae bacterium]|nr:GH3 auxin-responsive promoter family protein [Pirellulaceae bacterium]